MLPGKRLPKFKTVKEYIEFCFVDVETKPGRMVDFFIISLILLSSSIFVASTYPLSEDIHYFLLIADKVILFLFTLEYILRFYVAKNKVKHITNIYSLIDLVAILPFLLGFVGLGFVRVFRVFRILRLIRFIRRRYLFAHITSEEGYLGANVLFTIFCIIFVFAGLIYDVEVAINPEINTFFDAVYYAVVGLTTVGFGDVTTITDTGRVLTLLMILSGIIFVPWQVSTFFRKVVEKVGKVKIICKGCGLHYHEPDAIHCKACGRTIFNRKREG